MSESKPKDDLRIYCVVRIDINMPLGKLIAQTGHGFMGALVGCKDEDLKARYLGAAFTKIALKGKNLNALERAKRECDELGITTALITDSGRTVFNEPTVTCLGIGPVTYDQLPKYVQKMHLL